MLKIEKFDNIVVSTKMCFSTPNDTRFQLERKGFDKNGNPRYILSMSVENMLKIKENKKNKFYGRIYDVYDEDKCRLVFTSYNLSQDLKYLFEVCRIDSELVWVFLSYSNW